MASRAARFALAALTAVLLTGCEEGGGQPTSSAPRPEVVDTTSRPVAVAPSKPPVRRAAPASALLFAARGGDGDSWKDTHGVAYRLGLVNTPELSECYGEKASAVRKQLTAAGFRAQSYSVDDYGRKVSVVTLADGRNLNVYLARHGYANDKYLETFRHENPALAAQLDPAFAAARREHAGLWGACGSTSVQGFAAPQAAAPQAAPPQQATGSCDPSYPDVCIPPGPPDLDCGDISYRRFRVLAPDPHRFDADGDGIGCESG